MSDNNSKDIENDILTLPPVDLKIIRRNGVLRIYDPLRKNYYCLTPEEYVRQRFVAWLIRDLKYPISLMANERGIRLNQTYKRCDTVIFNNEGSPLMIIEYKAPNVKLTQDVFDQIARYHIALKTSYLVVSNGIDHYCCKIDNNSNKYTFLPKIPSYIELKGKS